jgi:ribonucleoside-triphosphate reductase
VTIDRQSASTIEQVKKRDGRITPFDRDKIVQAIMKAAQAVQGHDQARADDLADQVIATALIEAAGRIPTVEAVQDAIEKVLIEHGHARTAKAFILYRARRSRIREGKSELMETVADLLQAEQPSSKPGELSPDKLVAIGLAASQEYYLNRFLPESLAEAHLNGDLHLHGLPYYAKTPQAFALPYRFLLTRGFSLAHGHLRPPRRADSAAALTALMLQAAQADCFGGQVIASFDADWASALPATTTEAELDQAMEALVFQLNALIAPALGQLPRVTLQLGLDTSELGRAVTRSLLGAVSRGLGRGEVPLRPAIAFALRRGVNLDPYDPNYDLTRQAAALAARTPGVTFIHDEPSVAYAGHEARITGDESSAAGFGQVASVTINLPRLALRARRDRLDFHGLVEEAVDRAGQALRHRFDTLAARPVSAFPFLMAQGLFRGAAGLKPQDAIGPALRQGTLSIGFVGLAETLMVLGNAHHGSSMSSQAEGLALVRRLSELCAQLSARSGLRFVLHAAEASEVGARMARLDRREFGMIKGVTETPAYTTGVAVPADATLSEADRLALEAAYAPLLSGGGVSITVRDSAPDAEAVLSWIQQAVAAGARAFSLDYPLALCQACGAAGAPEGGCAGCEGPAIVKRRVLRSHGYLTLEA